MQGSTAPLRDRRRVVALCGFGNTNTGCPRSALYASDIVASGHANRKTR